MKSKQDAVIVDAVRSPIGKKNGALSHTRPDELAAQVLRSIDLRKKLYQSVPIRQTVNRLNGA